MEKAVREKLSNLADKYDRITAEMATNEVASNPERYGKLAKEQAAMSEVVRVFRAYAALEKQYDEAHEILDNESDAGLRELAQVEKDEAEEQMPELEQELKVLLLPTDPNDQKNTIVEIRAGTGGDEAALFAADLYRMYTRFAERKNWRVEVMNSNPTGIGGYKEITFKLTGDAVYSQLKFEGGTHRVQRVPDTETQGRVHTSAVTVAVLPEAEEVDVQINESELQIDVFRSSGPGGQSVNTTDSAVRVTHKPTGLVVSCQDEKSQHKNKAKAILVLRSRLLAAKQEEENQARSATRRLQVGTGDRSGKIRTYNYPQDRISDHRIGRTEHNLALFMDGQIQGMIDALTAADRADRMAAETEEPVTTKGAK